MISAPENRTTAQPDGIWHPLQSDHRSLRESVQRLDGLLRGLAAGTGAEGVDVRSLLAEFYGRLLAHLDTEEQSGILERAARAEPRLSRPVEKLRREHDGLRAGVRGLAAGPGRTPTGTDWAVFHARFATFCDDLEAHEQAENDVLHSAYMEDIGGRG